MWWSPARGGRRPGRRHRRVRALALYQGDFLADDLYEDWPVTTREHLLLDYLDVLDRLSGLYFGQYPYGACVALCRLLVERDPCREDAHRRLMRCFTGQASPTWPCASTRRAPTPSPRTSGSTPTRPPPPWPGRSGRTSRSEDYLPATAAKRELTAG